MINTILFDLDGTLLDRHSSLTICLHHQLERCRSVLDGISPVDYLAKVTELDAHGHTSKNIVFQQIESHFGLPEDSWKLLLDDFLAHFPDTCVAFPKMHQMLRMLQERSLSLGMVTNGRNASQNPKIDRLGIRDYFGAVLISEEEGVRKPDPEIFRRALKRVGAAPREAVFVGDNPEADINAAKSVGMKAIWMRDSYWPEPDEADAIISELCELPDVLDRLNKE